MQRYDTIVVGAGAAGMLAAARAAECGQRTLLLEKNKRAGTKILMSGGTRCNITHATDRRGIVDAFGEQGSFLHSALAALSPEEVVKLVESQGVATKVEPGGKIFPVSDRAADVLRALLDVLRASGCEVAFEEPLVELRRGQRAGSDSFHLTTSRRELAASRVILTTGGQSYPGSGTTGDGYEWLRSMGHTIVTPRPALTPVTTDEAWVRELKGLTISDVRLRVVDGAGAGAVGQGGAKSRTRSKANLDERRGSFLFTHFGMSGPVALDVSRVISGHPAPKTLQLICDFLPDINAAALDQQLREAVVAAGKKQIAQPLAQLVPRRLAEALMAELDIDVQLRAAELSKATRRQLVERMKGWQVPVSGTRGFKKAEVTAGGVSRDEVDSRTMASRIIPGLFIAGELLDVDGPIGGYNFQAAFSTGWLAGQSV